MLNEELRPFIVQNQVIDGTWPPRTEYTGLINIISDSDISWSRIACPVASDILIVDDEELLALGWKRWTDGFAWFGELDCGLTLYNSALEVLNYNSIFYYEFRNPDQEWPEAPEKKPQIFGMCAIDREGNSGLYIAYCDTSFCHLAELSLPELEIIQQRELPDSMTGGDVHPFSWMDEDSLHSYLILITDNGVALAFNSDNLAQVAYDSLPSPHIGSLMFDTNDDGMSELLYLTRERLICYEVGALFTPSDKFAIQNSEFRIISAYPNPFNNAVTIEYFLDRPGMIELEVHDLEGRQVASLVEAMTAYGRHNVVWNASGMASGKYLVTISAGDEMRTVPVVLAR